jgi:hypothetical protein
MMDARIQNPLDTPVWLLYRLGGRTLPTAVADMSLSKSKAAPQAYVWRFSGDRAFRALRIPAGADLSVRGLELSSWSDDQRLLVAFASALQVDDRAAEAWMGQAGIFQPHGTFGLDDVVTQAERHWDNFGAARLEVSVLCVTRADPDASTAPWPWPGSSHTLPNRSPLRAVDSLRLRTLSTETADLPAELTDLSAKLASPGIHVGRDSPRAL